MNEIWKEIKGYGGKYLISNMGNIKNNKRKILKQRIGKSGRYLVIDLGYKTTRKTYKVHRLVAQTFIPNPNNKPQVNHIDGNKHNNCVDNLEWATCRENLIHALKNNLRKPPRKPVYQIKNGIIIARFESIKEASIKTNTDRTSINKIVRGNSQCQRANGYEWRYANE